MEIDNLTHPGRAPAHGDLVRLIHPSGATEEKQWIDLPVEPEPLAYRALTKAEFSALVTADFTSAQKLALRKDEALELNWLELDDLAGAIRPDHAISADFLDAAVAAGHLTPDQRQAVLDSWPRA